MNSDLAYCLERFIDDQIQLIDGYLKAVKQNETFEYQRIVQMKMLAIAKRKFQITKGPHAEDAMIVERFLTGLLDIADSDNTANSEEVQKYREMMRTEFAAKIDDCSDHIVRLRNLARPTFHSGSFVRLCNGTIKRLRHEQSMTENYDKLDQLIDQSDQMNVADNVQHWWDRAYGSAVIKTLSLNKRFNPGVGNKDLAVVTRWSQPIDCARKILSVRKQEMLSIAQKKYDIVCEFVRQIQSIDDETRQEISEDNLIKQLNSNDFDFAKNYADKWLNKRDQRRNEKEDASFEILWQEAKVQFDRQRIAQNSKKLALASLLRRLAIGSDNIEQFDLKLATTLHKQKQNNCLPIITGDIGDPSIEKLPMTIHLEEVDMDQWSKNSNQIQDKFISSLCQAFLIPVGSIRIIKVECGSVLIRAYVEPPYGKNVIDSLNGTAPDSPARIKAVREFCLFVKGSVESITLGKYGLSTDRRLMDPLWNRKYLWSKSDTGEGEYWEKPKDQGGKPYFCPSGWFRFGIKVAENDKEFDALCGNWYLAYHGTKGKYAADILTSGLRVNTTGCYYSEGIPRVHVSPSIEYCAHRRYSEPWTKTEKNGKTRWFQVVLQCRVNPTAVKMFKAETLLDDDYKKTVTIDPNFLNSELEWVIPGKEGTYYMNHDIICYGLMMRVSDVDPAQLPTSKWWNYVDKQTAPHDKVK